MGKLTITNSASNNASNNGDLEKQQTTLPQPTAPKLPTASTNHGGLTLEQYRALVGIPQETSNNKYTQGQSQPILPGQNGFIKTSYGFRSLSNTNLTAIQENLPAPIRPATVLTGDPSTHKPRILILLRLFSRPAFARQSSTSRNRSNNNSNEAAEYATSLYYTLVREESDQWRLYHIYNIITYTCLILQLVIASALIILGAVPLHSAHQIAIAVLGATTGVLTGLLSLLKGQGFPNRLLQYANRLRQVRDKMEFLERALRAGVGAIVTYQDVIDLWNEFENVRNEREMNRPDVWTTSASATGTGLAGISGVTATQSGAAATGHAQAQSMALSSSQQRTVVPVSVIPKVSSPSGSVRVVPGAMQSGGGSATEPGMISGSRGTVQGSHS